MPNFIIEATHAVAVAKLDELMHDNPSLAQSKRVGSLACRYLLTLLQQRLGISGSLNETDLPYSLQPIASNQLRYYVSFSHSREQVAVLVALTPYLGIDVEDKAISLAVAKRYFNPHELNWLLTLSAQQQSQATKLLWVLKEAMIKQQGNAKLPVTLTHGLKVDILTNIGKNPIKQLLSPSSRHQPEARKFGLLLANTLADAIGSLTGDGYYLSDLNCGYVLADKIE